jgi:hypothetical protein
MDEVFFDASTAQELAPGMWLGGYSCIAKNALGVDFLSEKNIKIIINCGDTLQFLQTLELRDVVGISSDVIIISLDPSFDKSCSHMISDFVATFRKKITNYVQSFYILNPKKNLIHEFPDNFNELLLSPILHGSNLNVHFFNINRLVKLFRCVNSDVEVLILSETGNSSLSTALAITYLMDNYSYKLDPSFRLVQLKRPSIAPLNINFYDDLLIIENLKKFYSENMSIKLKNTGVLMTNCKLKRRHDDEENEEESDDLISVGGDTSKRIRPLNYY